MEGADSRKTVSVTVCRRAKTFTVRLRMTSVSEVLKALAEKQNRPANLTGVAL
jgi:hypothetical protein